MPAPRLSRPVLRGLPALAVLSICLLGAWLRSHRPGAAPGAPPPRVTAESSGGRDIAPAASPAPPSLDAGAPATSDPALTDPDSPLSTEDSERNRLWAKKHPVAALSWLRSVRAGEQRVAVAEILCADLMPKHPRAALALAESCRDGSDGVATRAASRNLLENLAQQWAERDFEAAADWALAKEPGESRERLLRRLAFARAETDPGAASRMVAREMIPGDHQDEAAMAVLHRWIQTDEGAALAWIESFPAGALRDRALDEVASLAAAPLSGPRPE